MTPTAFRILGPDHKVVLILTLLGILALIFSTRRIRRISGDRLLRCSTAFVLAAIGLATVIYNLSCNPLFLPLHLCDLALVFVVWALIHPQNRYVGELALLWGLAGSPQAILTPDLISGFPSLIWLSFFLTHCGVVLSAVYLMARGYVVLRPLSILRVWLITNGYLVILGILNWLLGTNFGYLAWKPAQPSLLDYFGPWPYYILGGELLAIILFFVCYALSRLVEKFGTPSNSAGYR